MGRSHYYTEPSKEISVDQMFKFSEKQGGIYRWFILDVFTRLVAYNSVGHISGKGPIVRLIDDYICQYGDAIACHAMAAIEKIEDEAPRYFKESVGKDYKVPWRIIEPRDKKEITQSLYHSVMEIEVPSDIRPDAGLIPGTPYYGKLMRCPLSSPYGGGEEISLINDHTKFTIPLDTTVFVALFEDHPHYKTFFWRGVDHTDNQGRSLALRKIPFSVPLSWIVCEYQWIKGMNNFDDHFIRIKIPRTEEEWGNIGRRGVLDRDLVVDEKLTKKIKYSQDNLLHSDPLLEDFNFVQEKEKSSDKILSFPLQG